MRRYAVAKSEATFSPVRIFLRSFSFLLLFFGRFLFLFLFVFNVAFHCNCVILRLPQSSERKDRKKGERILSVKL